MGEETSDGEAGGIGKEMVPTTHTHFLLFLSMLVFADVCVFMVFVAMHVAKVWTYFHPNLSACSEQLRSKMRVLRVVSIKLESNEHVTIIYVL